MLKEYIDTGYTPKKEDFICEYYVEPSPGISLEKASTHIAGESSIDTWTNILTLSPDLAKKLKPHVFSLNKKTRTIKIAYSPDLFELNSVPQFLSSIAGNILSMKIVKNIRLLDVSFPEEVIENFKGPKFGIQGVRELLEVKERPLIGTIVKPKLGLTPDKHAKVAYNSWVGGCDIVKDDENLTNQKFNSFETRIAKTLKLRDKAELQTGERKEYMPNITAPTCKEMLRRAKYVKNLGGNYLMIDIITTGWSALQTLREENEDLGMVLHAHRCMHSAFTRNKKQGVTMLVVAKLTRLIGMDQLHIGTAIGKMEGSKKEVQLLAKECREQFIEENDKEQVLEQQWHTLKRLFPVSSGGVQPGMIPKLIEIFGNDIIIQMGGGIHAHPLGTKAGAKAARQALEAALNENPLEEHAKKHKELKIAIEKWGK